MHICKTLGIHAVAEDNAHYLTEDALRLLEQYAQLDNYGRHTISSVMQVEYERCMESPRAKAKRAAETE